MIFLQKKNYFLIWFRCFFFNYFWLTHSWYFIRLLDLNCTIFTFFLCWIYCSILCESSLICNWLCVVICEFSHEIFISFIRFSCNNFHLQKKKLFRLFLLFKNNPSNKKKYLRRTADTKRSKFLFYFNILTGFRLVLGYVWFSALPIIFDDNSRNPRKADNNNQAMFIFLIFISCEALKPDSTR